MSQFYRIVCSSGVLASYALSTQFQHKEWSSSAATRDTKFDLRSGCQDGNNKMKKRASPELVLLSKLLVPGDDGVNIYADGNPSRVWISTVYAQRYR